MSPPRALVMPSENETPFLPFGNDRITTDKPIPLPMAGSCPRVGHKETNRSTLVFKTILSGQGVARSPCL